MRGEFTLEVFYSKALISYSLSSSLADNETARKICGGKGPGGRILIALSDSGSVHVLDLDPSKVSCIGFLNHSKS